MGYRDLDRRQRFSRLLLESWAEPNDPAEAPSPSGSSEGRPLRAAWELAGQSPDPEHARFLRLEYDRFSSSLGEAKPKRKRKR